MKLWDKICILCGNKCHKGCDEIDRFLLKNFIDNPKAEYFGAFDDDEYYFIVGNGEKYYAIWDKNRWYGWLSHCNRLEKVEESEDTRYFKITECLWNWNQPSRKVMLAFYKWLDGFETFKNPPKQRETNLTDDEL